MLLGTGKAVITAAGDMAGRLRQGRGADEVLRDLQLRVFWFQEKNETPASEAVCLITAELLGFEQITNAIRGDLAEQFGLLPESVMSAASHTHSGPQTCETCRTMAARWCRNIFRGCAAKL